MKGTKFMVALLSVLFVSGCAFKVKNTEGLRLAYEDIDRASSKAVQLKSLVDIDESKRREAADMYREAKAGANSYLNQVITDAADYKVEEPAARYRKLDVGEKVSAFRQEVDSLAANASSEKAAEWIPIAAEVLGKIKDLHDEEQEAAYKRFVDTVTQYKMMHYEELPGGGGE